MDMNFNSIAAAMLQLDFLSFEELEFGIASGKPL